MNETNICTYNIIAGGGNRLKQAMRTMEIMHIDIGILTESKLQEGKHTTRCNGYEIIANDAKSKYQGGVALFYRQNTKTFHVEITKLFGPNVIQTTLVSGKKKWM
jgi:exonuclease III